MNLINTKAATTIQLPYIFPVTCSTQTLSVALFPGSAQLSITCNTEKWGEPDIFSHVSMR